jgi:hypothetical protein
MTRKRISIEQKQRRERTKPPREVIQLIAGLLLLVTTILHYLASPPIEIAGHNNAQMCVRPLPFTMVL